MDHPQALRIIDATLKARGFVYIGPGAAEYEGRIRVHGKEVDIRVVIPDTTFAKRPQVHLRDRKQIPVTTLAHVEEETGICYASGVGLPVDIYEPGQAILRVLEEAQRTLELSYAGRGHAHLVDEYQAYWKPHLHVSCVISRAEALKLGQGVTYVAVREGEPEFIGLGAKPELRGYAIRAVQPARVLVSDQHIGPGVMISVPETLADLRQWCSEQPGLAQHRWMDILSLLALSGAVFFIAPNVFLGSSIKVPIHIRTAVTKGSIRKLALPGILDRSGANILLERIAGAWMSAEDVVGRNNSFGRSLADVSIALIGCGTIGGFLAKLLAQNGAGTRKALTLFDRQILTQGNISRHLLGFRNIDRSKASAVAEELRRFHPETNPAAVDDNAFAHLDQLGRHELVIDATGDWNVQSALNEWFLGRANIETRALLHGWVFMNGAAVQSFLNLDDHHACFRCLKPTFDGPWRFPAALDDEEPNVRAASCGDGSYIPFPADVPAMAAALASRAALEWANGVPSYRLRTVGTDLARSRYQKPRSPEPSPHCPACARRRQEAA